MWLLLEVGGTRPRRDPDRLESQKQQRCARTTATQPRKSRRLVGAATCWPEGERVRGCILGSRPPSPPTTLSSLLLSWDPTLWPLEVPRPHCYRGLDGNVHLTVHHITPANLESYLQEHVAGVHVAKSHQEGWGQAGHKPEHTWPRHSGAM